MPMGHNEMRNIGKMIKKSPPATKKKNTKSKSNSNSKSTKRKRRSS